MRLHRATSGGRGRNFRFIALIGSCSSFTGPSAAIPLPQGIPPVVTLVVLLRLTGVAAGLVRGGSSRLAESGGGNEDGQSQSGDERLHRERRRRFRSSGGGSADAGSKVHRLRRLDRGSHRVVAYSGESACSQDYVVLFARFGGEKRFFVMAIT